MEHKKGKYAEAIKIWKELAEKYSQDVGAQNALISAAEVAEAELKDLKLAEKLYRQFLDSNPQDIYKILMVKHKLDLLSQQKN